jgi:gluconokinase
MILILMGVTGTGKTTIGQWLARDLGWKFHDADDFHPPANVAKMRAGQPLSDADRRPWLEAIRDHIAAQKRAGKNSIVACSALKQGYRELLREGDPEAKFICLKADKELIRGRLEARRGHFMNPALLDSQFQTLEEPADALLIDVSPSPEEIAKVIRERLGL